MSSLVITRAQKIHNTMLTKIRRLSKDLKRFKKDFCANYYIIDIDVETLIVKADSKAIPSGFRKIILKIY